MNEDNDKVIFKKKFSISEPIEVTMLSSSFGLHQNLPYIGLYVGSGIAFITSRKGGQPQRGVIIKRLRHEIETIFRSQSDY